MHSIIPWRAASLLAGVLLHVPHLDAQGQVPLSLPAARERALRVDPRITAAREAVAAARARERQAGAVPNPTLAYGREQTSGDGQSNSQNVASIEMPVEVGLRSARRDVARARRAAAEARLELAGRDLAHEVTVAYARAVAADRQARIAARASAAFTEAVRVSQERLAAGDVAGYVHRRLRLEAARAATTHAEAVLAAHTARVALASLVATDTVPIVASALVLTDTTVTTEVAPRADSLVTLALRSRVELRALASDADAAAAEAVLTARERRPVPVLSAGFKNESLGQPESRNTSMAGFVAGLSVPLPIFDRGAGAIAAGQAESRRQRALVDAFRRRVAREVVEAHEAYRVVQEQVALLLPVVGPDALAALAAADVAYAEGEITLAEWLDVLRSYREAEASFASLQAEVLVRRAALERAVGASFMEIR